jgi:archaeosine-15-forming tRNA-guanine transglycosylase
MKLTLRFKGWKYTNLQVSVLIITAELIETGRNKGITDSDKRCQTVYSESGRVIIAMEGINSIHLQTR